MLVLYPKTTAVQVRSLLGTGEIFSMVQFSFRGLVNTAKVRNLLCSNLCELSDRYNSQKEWRSLLNGLRRRVKIARALCSLVEPRP